MDLPEVRIFLTHCVGKAWRKICKEFKVIVSSWWTSGLTLSVDGSQDSEWKLKMIRKYAGDCEVTPHLLRKLKIVNAVHDDLSIEPNVITKDCAMNYKHNLKNYYMHNDMFLNLDQIIIELSCIIFPKQLAIVINDYINESIEINNSIRLFWNDFYFGKTSG